MEVPNTILDKLDKKLDDVEDKFRTICKVSEEVNENCKSYAEAVKTNSPECENKPEDFKVIVQEAMGEYERAKVIDQQNVHIRKKNIIIFNAPESAHEASMNRKEDDISLFINICNEISDVEISKEYITQARRLGMRSENGKIRPLLITLNSEEAKKKIFSRLYKLKDLAQFKNISMSHDMTRDERTKTKLLIEEAK